MPKDYSREHPVTIHEGPMADKHGTDWRDDARKLEELNAKMIESPQQTLPNSMTSIDKKRPLAKSNDGTVDKTASGVGGEHSQD